MSDAANESRVTALKNAFMRITDKREKKVVNNLITEYKGGSLTAEMAYTAIVAIAELRLAKEGIKPEDLR
jgi:hypothetical protein